MSVSITEVIEAGGYDLNTIDDAEWLLSQEAKFDELLEKAKELINKHEEKENEKAEREYQKEFGDGDE